jgi:aryl-alcohol dehydrogenase-like predicted oxidoreductase
MSLPETAYVQLTPDLRICRLLNGMWQVSGAHGAIDAKAALQNMFAYHDAGFTTWDLADHYGPAEDFIGSFRREMAAQRGESALDAIQAFTKWVPRPGQIKRAAVEGAVGVSLRRMNVSTLDLLQFHWWDYGDFGYMDALTYLAQLRDEGKIRHLALTNFDSAHLKRITDAGIRVVSNQVQYSIIDCRPEVQMADYCREHDIVLLTYGTVCGGLLSEKYLGQPQPERAALDTSSLRKYKNMVDSWGGWVLFQELLTVLKNIADKHHVSIANVATRYILDKPAVAGVILGARLGLTDHRADNANVFNVALDADDVNRIHTVTDHSNDLFQIIGDCGDEYRRQ